MRERAGTAWVPTIHPFRADGEFDEQAFRAHLGRLAVGGLQVLVGNEGTGESFTFRPGEMELVLRIAKEELSGVTGVRGMGRMVHEPTEMVRFVELVAEVGLDGVHIYALDVGHGFVPSEIEQERYLRTVLDATGLPVVLSLHDAASYRYPIALLQRLLEDYPQIVGAIVTTSDIGWLWEILRRFGERIEVHAHTFNALTNLALGGDGLAGPEGNIAPALYASVASHHARGEVAAAHQAFREVMQWWHATGRFGSARGIKAALRLLDLPGGYVRPPRSEVTDAETAEILEEISRLSLSSAT